MCDVSVSVSVSYLDTTARKVSVSYLDTKSGEVCVSYLDTFKKYLWTPLVFINLSQVFPLSTSLLDTQSPPNAVHKRPSHIPPRVTSSDAIDQF